MNRSVVLSVTKINSQCNIFNDEGLEGLLDSKTEWPVFNHSGNIQQIGTAKVIAVTDEIQILITFTINPFLQEAI
jgi:hypothetical protein